MIKKIIELESFSSVLAVIPAKKVSKRLPSKNLKLFNGYPLIFYSIQFAKFSGIKNIIVSSDCDKIISYSKTLGIETVKRPKNLSSDMTPTKHVIKHALENFSKSKVKIKYVVTLQPTNPLRKHGLFETCFEKFNKNDYDSLISVGMQNKKLGVLDSEECYKPINYKLGSRGQDVKLNYFENGLIYLSKVENILKNDLLGNRIGTIINKDLPSNIDIDYIDDFKLGEILMNENYEDYKYLTQ